MMQACDKQKTKLTQIKIIHHLRIGFIFSMNDNNENKNIRNAMPRETTNYAMKDFTNCCFILSIARMSI
jgi:hypothetical protein